MGRLTGAQATFAELPGKRQSGHMGLGSDGRVDQMMGYICTHREPVKLLPYCTKGISYEYFVHNMMEVGAEYIQHYMEVPHRLGRDIPVLDKFLHHIIVSGMFNDIFEVAVHDMPQNQVMRDVDQLRASYTVG